MSMPVARDEFVEMALLVRSYQISKLLEVAASLGLADRVNERAKSAHELAKECNSDTAMLLRLCRALAAFGIFAVGADDTVAHTPKSRWLRSDANPTLHHAAKYWCMPSIWAAWSRLEDTIRTGKPSFEAVHGMPYFEFLKSHSADADLFDRFMQHSPDDRHAAVVEAYDFSNVRRIVDVGGGNGALLAAILAAYPRIEGVLFDREAVVATAQTTLGDQAKRCVVRPGDFFESVPVGGDVYTLSQILHDWNDIRCLQILTNCRNAIEANGRLLIIERILDTEPGRTYPMNFLADINMMLLFPGGKERTPAEFSRLFQKAGFAEARVIPTRSPFCIIETRPVN